MNFDDLAFQIIVDDLSDLAQSLRYKLASATDCNCEYVAEDLLSAAEEMAQVVCAAAFDQARERQARLEYVPVPAAKPDGIPMLSEISLEQSKKAAEKYLQWLNTIAEENK